MKMEKIKQVLTKRRIQNQKISFPFFAGSPHTPRRKRNRKEIFGFGLRAIASVRGACLHHHGIGAYGEVQSHHALRACEVNPQNPADFAHTMFELRPENTALFFKYIQTVLSLFVFCLQPFFLRILKTQGNKIISFQLTAPAYAVP
ncbi:MAG: hypothetical protein KBC35_00635 [Candidatus Pacebacteria bacterium]|nr:hypothetical protein [Candidatus Paceibacterota bacterium]